MARDEPQDIEALLAEVDRTVSGKSSPAPKKTDPPTPWLRRTEIALAAAVCVAAAVWLAFAILPFLGAFSGAAGAFVGAFVAVLLFRRRR
jgi:ferric-dicitrate binding protein FerR (iron transport regulator)